MNIEDVRRANHDRVQAQKEEIACYVPTGWTESLLGNPKIINPDKDYNSHAIHSSYLLVVHIAKKKQKPTQSTHD
jgi:hypothetical protein